MKRELQKEFESLVCDHMDTFYANAYTVEGNREDAEYLTETALLWAAGKFAGLASKARIIDLISERIGEGGLCNYSPTDTDALLARVMKKIEARGKIKMLFLSAGALVLMAVIFSVAIPKIPFDTLIPADASAAETETDAEGNVILPVIGEVKMAGTQTVKGDNGVVTFENYHNISKTLGVKTVLLDGMSDGATKIDRYIASASAPDGTSYIAFTDIVISEDSANNQFTLYRMEKDGWKSVGEGESASYYGKSAYWESYDSSHIYMETDAESNV